MSISQFYRRDPEHQTCAPEEAPDAEESIDNRAEGFICLVEQVDVKRQAENRGDNQEKEGKIILLCRVVALSQHQGRRREALWRLSLHPQATPRIPTRTILGSMTVVQPQSPTRVHKLPMNRTRGTSRKIKIRSSQRPFPAPPFLSWPRIPRRAGSWRPQRSFQL